MSPCASCHGGCCRAFAVPLTGDDIHRIITQTGRSFWEFACRWSDPDGRIAGDIAPHFSFDDSPEERFVIGLLHQPSRLFPSLNGCVFLDEEPPTADAPLGRGTCSIYEHRPRSCRIYPAVLTDEGRPTIPDATTRFDDVEHSSKSLCPRPWTEEDLEQSQLTDDIRICSQEMNFFHHVAEYWNRRPKPWSVFPEFLQMIYEQKQHLVAESPAGVLPS